MVLRGTGVKIIVHEPYSWDKGNLFGIIIFCRGGNKLIVRLINTISDSRLISILIELLPHKRGDALKQLIQYYTVVISGSLIGENIELKAIFNLW